MNFPDQGCQKLEHYEHTDRKTDVLYRVQMHYLTPYSRVVETGLHNSCLLIWA